MKEFDTSEGATITIENINRLWKSIYDNSNVAEMFMCSGCGKIYKAGEYHEFMSHPCLTPKSN